MLTQTKTYSIQTYCILLLPLLLSMFNTHGSQDKSKVYAVKDASHQIIPSKTIAFGQSRFISDEQKMIQSDTDLAQLYAMDWSSYALKTIVIDPGHGGKDEGTISPDGTQEKTIALSISKKLGDYIKASYPDVNIIYTRTSDKFIELRKRADIANKNKADLFISIHCNSFKKSSVRGTETYVMGLHRAKENMDVIKRENDVVTLEEDYENQYEEYGVDESSPLYDILMNSYQNAFLEQSLNFAATIEDKLTSHGHKTRGVHQAGFMVLRRTAMPSVLIETGYLTNASDRAILTSEAGQNKLASQIYYAFADYKASLDDKRTGKVNKVEEAPKSETTTTPKPKAISVKYEEKSTEVKESKGIEFGVQLASNDQLLDLDESKWKLLKDRISIEKSGNTYRYILKDFGIDYKKAKQEKNTLRNGGFTGCFLVAYQNGKRVELYKAKRELGL